MNEIYSFTVELSKEKEKKVEKTIIDKDTGEEKTVSVNEKFTEKEPVRVILKEPNRRQIEEADMEYSIEISQCIKRGILTKAMLAKKYSDSGGLMAETALRRDIVDTETAYASLFNHTADTKAQNRVILWYVLNLAYVARGEEDPEPLFVGDSFEQKENHYYELDEAQDELYLLVQSKLATFVSYWYFTAGVTRADIEQLDKDIEEGNV